VRLPPIQTSIEVQVLQDPNSDFSEDDYETSRYEAPKEKVQTIHVGKYKYNSPEAKRYEEDSFERDSDVAGRKKLDRSRSHITVKQP